MIGNLELDCAYCHGGFLAHRKSARYCSPDCRKAAWREQQKKLIALEQHLDRLARAKARRDARAYMGQA